MDPETSEQSGDDRPRFLCDAMLGGLARWLRAAGYDAQFEYGIDDRDLVQRAQASGRWVLSSDGPLFERTVIRRGVVRALYIPQQLGKLAQLRFVLEELKLPLRSPRCMACGGRLIEVPKHQVMGEAPPLAYRNCQAFWRCEGCGKLFWHGTHWQKITRRLDELGGRGEARRDPKPEVNLEDPPAPLPENPSRSPSHGPAGGDRQSPNL